MFIGLYFCYVDVLWVIVEGLSLAFYGVWIVFLDGVNTHSLIIHDCAFWEWIFHLIAY